MTASELRESASKLRYIARNVRYDDKYWKTRRLLEGRADSFDRKAIAEESKENNRNK
jgi:hypothetical protein